MAMKMARQALTTRSRRDRGSGPTPGSPAGQPGWGGTVREGSITIPVRSPPLRSGYGVVRGSWSEGRDEWKAWWGDEPPYHTSVFVLTHHTRAPLKMKGGTTFHFVTDGIHSTLKQATDEAG